jgi:hypothetical protein
LLAAFKILYGFLVAFSVSYILLILKFFIQLPQKLSEYSKILNCRKISGSHGGEYKDDSSGTVRRVLWSEVFGTFAIRTTEAASTFETSVNYY